MLSYIYRHIRNFELQHSVLPNLLYINQEHAEPLKESVDEDYTLRDIAELLQLEFVINQEVLHPHVAWTQSAIRIAS
ncbi:MAG: hypothetical protein P8Y28_07485 [Gammaproteobacteria bacterium]